MPVRISGKDDGKLTKIYAAVCDWIMTVGEKSIE
jgi:hypothetical protein